MAVALDDPERLVPEDELVLALRCDAEKAVHDLAVGPAHADLEHAHRYLVDADHSVGDVFDARARAPGLDDERFHDRTAPSDAGPTSAR